MRPIFVFIAILFILLVLLRFTRPSYEGFEAPSKRLLICKMEGCGHCRDAMPEFQKLIDASPLTLADGSKVAVRLLDAQKDDAEIRKYGVKGFPTTLYDDGTKVRECPGERTERNIMKFLNSIK